MYKNVKSDQERFDELDKSLDQIDLSSLPDTITLSSGHAQNSYNFANVSLPSNITGSISSVTSPYTFSNGTTSITANPWATSTRAGKLQLNGEDADIEINGVSILKILQDRLNVLIPNPELESEWDELKELGDLYRQKEIEFKEKSEMWKKLKSSPKVDREEW
jgi:hypothetical protein